MSEEQTERFEGGTPFETRVLSELGSLNNRMTVLEEKVEARLHDTRPIREAVLARLSSMEARLDSMDARLAKMDAKFDVVGSQLRDMRGDIEMLRKRPPAA